MCIIIYKPKGAKIQEKTLADMWAANPDGAGIGIPSDGKCYVIKGLMKLSALQTALHDVGSREAVIHLRVATHGVIDAAMTHPFALSTRPATPQAAVRDTMRRNGMSFKSVVFHNGIIQGYGDDEISDSAAFCHACLSQIPSNAARLAVLRAIPSKFAVVHTGKVYLIGDFQSYQGLSVSNTYFAWQGKHIKSRPSKPYRLYDMHDIIDSDWIYQGR